MYYNISQCSRRSAPHGKSFCRRGVYFKMKMELCICHGGTRAKKCRNTAYRCAIYCHAACHRAECYCVTCYIVTCYIVTCYIVTCYCVICLSVQRSGMSGIGAEAEKRGLCKVYLTFIEIRRRKSAFLRRVLPMAAPVQRNNNLLPKKRRKKSRLSALNSSKPLTRYKIYIIIKRIRRYFHLRYRIKLRDKG